MTDNILKKHVERTSDKDFAKIPYVKTDLQTYCGTVKARVKWKPGVFTDECDNQVKVLVVESRVGGHPIWLYVTCPDSASFRLRSSPRVVGFRVSAEGPDGLGGKSRPVLGQSGNIFRPVFSGVP